MSEVKTVPNLTELRARRAEILAIAQRRGAYNVRVFGSVARGDTKPESDVDFLVNLVQGTNLYDVSGLLLDLRELLGYEVDVVVEHPQLRERLRQRILKDTVPL